MDIKYPEETRRFFKSKGLNDHEIDYLERNMLEAAERLRQLTEKG